MAPDFRFGFGFLMLLFFTVFTVFLVQIPHSIANPNDQHCPPNSELKISNNSILDPSGINGKLRKQFQLDGPEECPAKFTVVFPLKIDVNSDFESENGNFLEDYKEILEIECSNKGSTTESMTVTGTEKSLTPILISSSAKPESEFNAYNLIGKIPANDTKFLGLSLCAPNEKDEDCWLRMNIMANGEVKVLTKINGQKEFDVYEWENFTMHANSSLNLTILFRQYYIEFRLEYNGTHFNFHHLPAFWYKTVNAVQYIHYEIVGDWEIVEFIGYKEAKLPTHSELFPVPIPWSEKFKQEITVQSYITIRGHVKSAANKFHITFLHNAPEANAYIGKTVVDVTFDLLEQNIYLASNDGKDVEVKNKIPSVLKPNVFFEAVFVAKNETAFEMHVFSSNGERNFTILIDLPLWSITHMNIRGDIELFVNPNVIFEKTSKVDDYSVTLFPPLDVGDVISIEFTPNKGSTECSVWLLAGAKEHIDMIGHTPLHIKFKYDDKTVAQTFMSSTQIDKCCELENEDEVGQSLFRAGTSAALTITFNKNAFNLVVNEGDTGNFEYKNSGFPPWSVDHIQVIGDSFKKVPKIEVHRKEKEYKLDLPYILVLDKNLVVGDTIEIKGKKTVGQITVYLLHGALNHHEKIGQTVLQIQIGMDSMRFNAFYGGTWKKEHPYILRPLFLLEQTFTVRIKVEKDVYKIALVRGDNIIENPFNHQLPIWAVEYIRIEGDLKLAQAPVVVH